MRTMSSDPVASSLAAGAKGGSCEDSGVMVHCIPVVSGSDAFAPNYPFYDTSLSTHILLPAGKRLKTSQQEAARSGVREHVGRFRVRARLQML